MHIEANVAKSILQTICGFDKKKNIKVRVSCEAHEVHPSAWMIPGCIEPQHAPWVLPSHERQLFMK